MDKYIDDLKIRRVDLDFTAPTVNTDDIYICRRDSDEINYIRGIFGDCYKKLLFTSVLKIGGTDQNRDGDGVRVNADFAQIQSTTKPDEKIRKLISNLYVDGQRFLQMMDVNLKQKLGHLLEYMTEVMKKQYPQHFDNIDRTDAVERHFINKYWPGRKILFEYINFPVKKS